MFQQNQMNNCNMMNNPMNPNMGVMGGTGPMMGNQNMGMGMNNMGMGMNNMNNMGMGMNNMGMGMNNNMGMGMNNMNDMNNMGMGMNNMGMGMNNMNNMGMGMNNMNQMGSNTMGPMGMNNMMNNMGMGMNNQMGMNQMFMNSMGPMGMNNMMANMAMMQGMMPQMQKAPMTEEQKKQLRMQGYLMGKKMAEERKKRNAANNPNPTPTVQEGPATGELSIKFKKGGSVTTIKMDAGSMVAELINEYFLKSHTTSGTFKYNNNALDPNDTSSLAEAGLKNNSEISVS